MSVVTVVRGAASGDRAPQLADALGRPPGSHRSAAEAGSIAPHRDRSIDLVRSFLLLVVVGLHSSMVAVSVGPEGFVLGNALEGQGWFAPASWLVQIMPLFFLIGGFSSHTHWSRMRERGHSASSNVVGRLHRLLVPTLVSIAAVGIALAVMTLSGVPAQLIATAGYRLSQPLWFLGVYVLCSALVPLLVAAHSKRPVLSLAVLVGAAGAADVLPQPPDRLPACDRHASADGLHPPQGSIAGVRPTSSRQQGSGRAR